MTYREWMADIVTWAKSCYPDGIIPKTRVVKIRPVAIVGNLEVVEIWSGIEHKGEHNE